jgi:FHS family L-fucose permease-like MFS transporter
VLLGFLTIFLVLGAEAVLFSNYRNYLLDPAIAGLSASQSLTLNTTFMAVFAAGRLTASWIQKRVKPATTLAFNLIVSLVLLGVIMTARGTVAVVAVTAIGFFVSIFFPTLYALAIEGMGEQTAQASGLLTMGFLGCAILPVVQGWMADRFGLQSSYAICAVPYLLALLYTIKTTRSTKI